jgi:SAM-dependent methyltransferase
MTKTVRGMGMTSASIKERAAGRDPVGSGGPRVGVKGYTRGVLSERALTALLDELGREAGHGVDATRSRVRRREAGAYFTPAPLVRFVVAETLRARFRARPVAWRRDGSPELVVLDPAAGDGRFLAEATRQLARRAAARGYDGERAARAIAKRCVIGVERDPEFAALARAQLGEAQVVCGEALLDPPAALAEPVDIVLGNPPYVRSIHLGRADAALRDALRGRYAATSHGEWDLYAAFLEQSLDWLRPGGEVGFVLPSRWLTASFAARLREKLARENAVRALVDFGARQLFEGATTYAALVFLSRRTATRAGTRVHIARLGEASWQLGAVRGRDLDGRPWRVAIGAGGDLLARLEGGPRLGDVARIAKGAGTNADRVYLLEEVRRKGALIEGTSRHLGRRVEVEEAIARPGIRGRDVRGYGAAPARLRCVFPYDAQGALLSPKLLTRSYPRAAAYLQACRDRLDARENGRFSGPMYYRFGRPQNLAFHASSAPKVVFPDVAREGRALWDASGAMLLDTAYAIRIEGGDYPLEVVLAVMNSPVVTRWLRETGIRLRGDYVRMKTAYLASLPLPRPSAHTRAISELLGEAGDVSAERRAHIDDCLRRAYGLAPDAWRALAGGATAPGSR